MPKITLTDLTTLTNETSAISSINANSALIETAIENTLSRDGSSPNSMGANLDMNSYRIQNLVAAVGNTEPVRKAEFDGLINTVTTIYNNTATLYDNFDDRYLGAKNSDPALDNDGNALIAGALYFNSVGARLKTYNGTTWDFISSKWITGTGTPSGGTGADGDFYLRSNGDVYQKVSGNWGAVLFTLTSVAGATGAQGPTGPAGPAVSDGDKGDITVSASGTTWTIDAGSVGTSKLGGDITTAGKALLDDADASAQRTTLGLGTLATQSGTFSGTSSGTNTGDQTITLTGDVTGTGTGSFAATIAAGSVSTSKLGGDITTAGKALLDDADAAAQRTTLGLGTLATQSGTFSGTSSGTNTGDQSLFSTIAVSGQSNVVADTTSDTLTLVAGTNVTITTDATTDSITINASSGGGSTMEYIAHGVQSGTGAVSFTSIPSGYTTLYLYCQFHYATGGRHRVALSSNNGSSYGAVRNITSAVGASGAAGGWVAISNVSASGSSKVVTPSVSEVERFDSTANRAADIYTTTATETVITGLIDALQVTCDTANNASSITLYGVV